ncbi:MAG: hypothetical protein ABSF23_17620 [Terracidiphilus sp.]|jgi:hypothetical protein
MEKRTFPVFKTIMLGRCQSPGAYSSALQSARCRVDDSVAPVIKTMAISPVQTEVDLVAPLPEDLGGSAVRDRKEMFAYAVTLGLQVCPAEVGPALRLAYPNQPHGEWIIVAMDPFVDPEGPWPAVFGVVHDYNERWLQSIRVGGDLYMHSLSYRWVFVQPRA